MASLSGPCRPWPVGTAERRVLQGFEGPAGALGAGAGRKIGVFRQSGRLLSSHHPHRCSSRVGAGCPRRANTPQSGRGQARRNAAGPPARREVSPRSNTPQVGTSPAMTRRNRFGRSSGRFAPRESRSRRAGGPAQGETGGEEIAASRGLPVEHFAGDKKAGKFFAISFSSKASNSTPPAVEIARCRPATPSTGKGEGLDSRCELVRLRRWWAILAQQGDHYRPEMDRFPQKIRKTSFRAGPGEFPRKLGFARVGPKVE